MATQTKTAPEKESRSSRALPLSDILKEYVRGLPQETKQKAQPEISKFIRWVGDKSASTLIASEIGEYSEIYAPRATTADAAERMGAVKNFLNYLKKSGHTETNLGLHLRIRKGRTANGKGKTISGSSTEIKLTKAGHSDLTKRLAQLQEERVRLASEIHRAAADKDVRENSPLEAARENQGMVVARIREIEGTLKHAVILDDDGKDRSRVQIGSRVTLKDTASERVMAYQLVEPNEASPLNGKISVVSPVGAAILGRGVGDKVKVNTPSGPHVYLIEKAT
ncbi:MAG: transcription elongation factor GreA [Dehalococcoidia bacterium]|nr:transcription elongation factor GreA [Dehalococcoidia bacterium]MSQ35209.1 transcription elongation factor GreA [Dehalococcoidia bacterium]